MLIDWNIDKSNIRAIRLSKQFDNLNDSIIRTALAVRVINAIGSGNQRSNAVKIFDHNATIWTK